jgi:hypothetical protein
MRRRFIEKEKRFEVVNSVSRKSAGKFFGSMSCAAVKKIKCVKTVFYFKVLLNIFFRVEREFKKFGFIIRCGENSSGWKGNAGNVKWELE